MISHEIHSNNHRPIGILLKTKTNEIMCIQFNNRSFYEMKLLVRDILSNLMLCNPSLLIRIRPLVMSVCFFIPTVLGVDAQQLIVILV